MGVQIGASWQIRLNDACTVAVQAAAVVTVATFCLYLLACLKEHLRRHTSEQLSTAMKFKTRNTYK